MKNEVACKKKICRSWVNWNAQFRTRLSMLSSELENVKALKNYIQTWPLVKRKFQVSRKFYTTAVATSAAQI